MFGWNRSQERDQRDNSSCGVYQQLSNHRLLHASVVVFLFVFSYRPNAINPLADVLSSY